MAEQASSTEEAEVSRYQGVMYGVSLRGTHMVLSRRFPPRSYSIKYSEVSSVEHRRLVDTWALLWCLACAGLAYAFNMLQFFRDIVGGLVTEINMVTKTVSLDTSSAILVISVIFGFFGIFYGLKAIISLLKRMVVYRSGKEPIAMPMPLTGKALQTLMEVNKKVKEAGGVSKIEVERLIDERLTGLLVERVRMQDDLIHSMAEAVKGAKTDEEKAKLKVKLEAGVKELKSKDAIIEGELQKTGLSKEELYKKYRIRPPDEKFMNAILTGALD